MSVPQNILDEMRRIGVTPPVPSGGYDDLVNKHAAEQGLDPDLIRSVMRQESSGDPSAVSPKGARGLMQLMPATAARFGVTNVNDPDQNIGGGAKYLRFLLDRYRGDVARALAGYNAGEGNVDKFGGIPPFAETQNYVRSITSKYKGPGYARPSVPAQVADEIARINGTQSSGQTPPAIPAHIQEELSRIAGSNQQARRRLRLLPPPSAKATSPPPRRTAPRARRSRAWSPALGRRSPRSTRRCSATAGGSGRLPSTPNTRAPERRSRTTTS